MTGIWFPTMAENFQLSGATAVKFHGGKSIWQGYFLPEMGKMRNSYYLGILRQVDILIYKKCVIAQANLRTSCCADRKKTWRRKAKVPSAEPSWNGFCT